MTSRVQCLFAAALSLALGAVPASAQIYFADNFESPSDSTTAIGNASIGGDPNGDADPTAQVGVWDLIAEPNPWKIQATQANTAAGPGTPGPGPASGANALGIERYQGGQTEARGAFNAAATGLLSVEFDMWINYGELQFFPRNNTGNGYDNYPLLINFTPAGEARVNGTLSAPFFVRDTGTGPADIDYNHVEILIDLPGQSFSLSVDGNTLPSLQNVAFPINGAAGTTPVSQLQQVTWGEPTGEGMAYIDNVVVQTIPEPASIGLLAMAGVGVMARRRRRA